MCYFLLVAHKTIKLIESPWELVSFAVDEVYKFLLAKFLKLNETKKKDAEV